MTGAHEASDAARGVAFPRAADGSRSTTHAGAAILSAALAPLSADDARAATAEQHWRRNYPAFFRKLVEGGLASGDSALASARAGLDAAWNTMRWEAGGDRAGLPGDRSGSPLAGRGAGDSIDLRTALDSPSAVPGSASDGGFETLTVRGRGEREPARWVVPYRGEQLGGESLRARLVDWQNRGIIEPGAVRALLRCMANPDWFDLSDRHLVLLGAGSEAGPLRWLMRWRANVVAIDVPRADVWRRIADIAYSGNGQLIVPVRRGASAASAPAADSAEWFGAAGADLISDAPDLARWLASLDRPLDVGALAYLDGERHVRVAMGMDMIAQALTAGDARHTLAFLATPTDVFAVARETAEAAVAAYLNRPMTSRTLQSSLRLASGDRFFQPNIERLVDSGHGRQYGVVDSLVLEQGPNYALAKRIQQWRALCARAEGRRVSLNVAPSTTTASVVKNPALAAGFKGASSFGIEAFEPQTTNALMAALWVHDLRCDEAAANPAVELAHPFELFMANACHGGLWRSAYLPRSALPFAAALGWVRKRLGG